jgi:hypothetical protein
MVKILVAGTRESEVRREILNALGTVDDRDDWVISAVELPTVWVVYVLVSPGDRLTGWSWVGPRGRMMPSVAPVLAGATSAQPAA